MSDKYFYLCNTMPLRWLIMSMFMLRACAVAKRYARDHDLVEEDMRLCALHADQDLFEMDLIYMREHVAMMMKKMRTNDANLASGTFVCDARRSIRQTRERQSMSVAAHLHLPGYAIEIFQCMIFRHTIHAKLYREKKI